MKYRYNLRLKIFIILLIIVLLPFNEIDILSTSNVKAANNVKTGNAKVNKVCVRKKPNKKSALIRYKGKKVKLKKGKLVKILRTKGAWYGVSFSCENHTLSGYVLKSQIKLKSTKTSKKTNTTKTTKKTNTNKNTKTTYASVKKTLKNSNNSFENELSNEGFPESYKVYLRKLHKKYPSWKFKAYHTGIKFSTAVKNEAKKGRSLIYDNGLNIAYKSMESFSYDWSKDKFKAYDGSKWVNASKEVIKYYMDPRNFLYKNSIYQFENLSYNKNIQKQAGVEKILKDSYMYKKKVTYKSGGKKTTKYYSAIFMAAAKYSKVSPYHLASRVKQEVSLGKYKLSYSANGKLSGYKNLYNFYNIRAGHSTSYLGSVKNGLKFAKKGSNDKLRNKKLMIPWNTQYKSIVGGSYYIGADYINAGQNTLYLQRFNVTNKGRYVHQYMSNVEAVASEGKRVGKVYNEITNNKGMATVFSIPVYKNMPSKACKLPKNKKNPNNYLKKLGVIGHKLSPSFNNRKNQTYTIYVSDSVKKVKVYASAVNKKAKVKGRGYRKLKDGDNTLNVKVIAQNGKAKIYKIFVKRK